MNSRRIEVRDDTVMQQGQAPVTQTVFHLEVQSFDFRAVGVKEL